MKYFSWVIVVAIVGCCGLALADSAYQPFTNRTTTGYSGWRQLEDDTQRIQVVGYGKTFTGSTTIPGETEFKPYSSTVTLEFANNTSVEPGVPVKSWTTDMYDIVDVLKGYIRFYLNRDGTDAVNVVVTPRRDK